MCFDDLAKKEDDQLKITPNCGRHPLVIMHS